MAQVGIYSAYQLGLHNHLNNENGGILHDYSRYGAFRTCDNSGALSIQVGSDAEVGGNNFATQLVKEILINEDYRGTFRIRWDHRSTAGVPEDIQTAFRINGVLIWTAPDYDGVGYETVNYDHDDGAGGPVDLQAGDRLQIYARRVGATEYRVRNFRIYYDWAIAGFGDPALNINRLLAALALTDGTLLDVTAVL